MEKFSTYYTVRFRHNRTQRSRKLKTTYLTESQSENIRVFLSGSPMALSSSFNRHEFPRELDVYIYDAEPGYPVTDWDDKSITSGRFFDLVTFTNMVLAALIIGHDRYGIFGKKKVLSQVDPRDIRLTKDEYDRFIEEIKAIILSMEPDLQFRFNKKMFLLYGPTVTGFNP